MMHVNGARSVGLGIIALGVCGITVALSATLGQAPTGDELWNGLTQDAYSKHTENVRKMLPSHSGLPPILDLSKSASTEEVKDSAWERDWKGLFVSGTFTDPGLQGPPGATSIATTFHDGIYGYDFPARACDAVIVAKATGMEERIDHSRSFVYARSTLEILRVLKGKNRNGIRSGAVISAVQFGGSVRFPSGHVETFILAGNGFLELGKQYIIFMWKRHPSTDTYIVGEAYLISDNLVFSIDRIPDESTYDGMPLEKFEARVKAAIAKNIDSD